jgi:4-amino-4-deoxy-L-arabinose transferase-like glycosyltransferase
VGEVGRQIATGHGFSWAGPTAFVPPAYPFLLAGIFKVFGVYTWDAAVAALILNALLSALTCFTIFHIARRIFGAGVAALSGWAWTFSALSVANAEDVNDAPISAFLFTLLFLYLMRFNGRTRLRYWAAYGLLWGGLGLLSPALLTLFPCFLVWLWWRNGAVSCAPRVCAAALGSILAISPWLVRNYLVFNRFIPIRSALPLALYWGNNAGKHHPHPSINENEMEKLGEMGESAYMDQYGREAVGYIETHKAAFVEASLTRVFGWWEGPSPWFSRSRLETAGHLLYRLKPPFALCGLLLALRRRRSPWTSLFLISLLFYPTTYYATEVTGFVRFRLPIEPLITILAALFAAAIWTRYTPDSHRVYSTAFGSRLDAV